MKIQPRSKRAPRPHCRGITLIECLVYISALAVVFGLGLKAFYSSFENSAALRRNADDIAQTLSVGERWRADIRAATQPPRFDSADQTFYLPQANGEVAYKFTDGKVLRRSAADANWQVAHSSVQQSEMIRESRAHVTAWRWELELKTRRRPALVRPLFTFTAATNQP
jgi:Tfp pilus assembly protein FimT